MPKRIRPSHLTDREYRRLMYHDPEKKQLRVEMAAHKKEMRGLANIASSSSNNNIGLLLPPLPAAAAVMPVPPEQPNPDPVEEQSIDDASHSTATASPTSLPNQPTPDPLAMMMSSGTQLIHDKLRNIVKRNNLSQATTRDFLEFLKDPTLDFASLHSLPKDPRTLMGVYAYQKAKHPEEQPDFTDDFVYFGIEKCLNKIVEMAKKPLPDIIELYMNADGLPFFSSSHSLTPVLISTNIDPSLVGIVSIYHVQKAASTEAECPLFKSKSSIKSKRDGKMNKTAIYLSSFIKELNALNGKFNGKRLVLKYVTTDLVALAEMKSILGHAGKHGCPRCTQVGIHQMNRMTFPNKRSHHEDDGPLAAVELRTDVSFRDRWDSQHHHFPTPTELESKFLFYFRLIFTQSLFYRTAPRVR